MNFELEATEA